jgi:hypothetical protein
MIIGSVDANSSDMPKNLLYGFRMLAKSPGFTTVAPLSMFGKINLASAVHRLVTDYGVPR